MPPTSPVPTSTPGPSSWSPPRVTVTRRRSSRPSRGRPAFIGLVASRKRGETVLGYLADQGVPRELLDEVRVPVGLDLGHTSHPEIAVAVLAELVELRAKGALDPEPEEASTPTSTSSHSGRGARHRHRPGLRDDGARRRDQSPLRIRGTDLLLLLPGLPDGIREGPDRLYRQGDTCSSNMTSRYRLT